MGESGTIKGADVVIESKYVNRISMIAIACPAEVELNQVFTLKVRVTNNTAAPVEAMFEDRVPSLTMKPLPPVPAPTHAASYSAAVSSALSPSASSKPKPPSLRLDRAPSASTPGPAKPSKPLPNQSGLCIVGMSSRYLGPIPAGGSIEVELAVCPLLRGLQSLKSCQISDRLTGTVYPIEDDMCEVFVSESEVSAASRRLAETEGLESPEEEEGDDVEEEALEETDIITDIYINAGVDSPPPSPRARSSSAAFRLALTHPADDATSPYRVGHTHPAVAINPYLPTTDDLSPSRPTSPRSPKERPPLLHSSSSFSPHHTTGETQPADQHHDPLLHQPLFEALASELGDLEEETLLDSSGTYPKDIATVAPAEAHDIVLSTTEDLALPITTTTSAHNDSKVGEGQSTSTIPLATDEHIHASTPPLVPGTG